MLPLGSQQGGLELLWQNGDKGYSDIGGNEMDSFLCLFPGNKTGGDQLLDDTGTGCRRAQTLSLSIVGHFILSGVFHSGEQSILGKVRGRSRETLLDFRAYDMKLFTLRHGRQACILLSLVIVGFPADIRHSLTLSNKDAAAAVDLDHSLAVAIHLGYGTQNLTGNELQYLTFPDRKRGTVDFTGMERRDDRMVVTDFGTVADLSQHGYRGSLRTGDIRSAKRNASYAVFHIIRQISAVGAGIGAELLLIKALNIIQSLLGGIAKGTVRISLQRGQVIKGRSFLTLFLGPDRLHGRLPGAAEQGFSVGFVFLLFAHSGEITEVQFSSIESLRLKCVDLCLALYKQRQRGRNYPPDIQSAVIEHGKQPSGIDANKPICPFTASGCGEEVVILLAGFQLTEALLNRSIFHGGDPQTQNRLLAAGHSVNIPKDQLSLASGITGVDDLGHISAVHKLMQRFKLLILVTGDFVLPTGGDDGKIIVFPLGILFIVALRIYQLSQMTETPGHDIVAAFQIAVISAVDPQNCCNGYTNGRFLSDHKSFHHRLFSSSAFPSISAIRSASSISVSSSSSSSCPKS